MIKLRSQIKKVKIRLIFLLLALLIIPTVFALSPTLEVECCGYLGHWEDSYDERHVTVCPPLNLTKEKCEPIMASFAKLTEWYAGEVQGRAAAREAERLNKIFGAAGIIILALIVWYLLTRKKKIRTGRIGKKR